MQLSLAQRLVLILDLKIYLQQAGILLGTTTEGAVNADELTIASTGNTGMTLRSPSTGSGNIFFSSATSGTSEAAGFITYGHNNGDLSFGTGTDERMRIDTNGLVMIGTTTEGFADFGDDLTLSSSGNTGITVRSGTTNRGSIYFSDGTSGDAEYQGYVQYNHDDNRLVFGTTATERIRIDSSGNVGIGTTSPASTLHLDASGGAVLRLQRTSSNATNKIEISHDGTDGTLESTNATLFRNSGSERMRIASDGKVGIGTSSPNYELQVNDPSGTVSVLQLTNTTTGTGAGDGLLIYNSGVNALISNEEAGDLRLQTSGLERMRIDSSGKVGIGTTAPEVMLDIRADDPSVQLVDTSATNAYGNLGFVGDTFILTSRGGTSSHGIIDFRRYNGSTIATSMRIDALGNVLHGVTSWGSSSGGLKIENATGGITQLGFSRPSSYTSTQNVIFNYHNGTYIGGINTSTTATSFVTSSDYRLKENVVALSDGITRLKTLKPSRFNFIADTTTTLDGFLAHEVTAVPEAIIGTKDEVDSDNNPKYQAIDQSKLVPLLTAALQEAIAKIETLETKVTALEAA